MRFLSKVKYDHDLFDRLPEDEGIRHNVISGNFSLAPGLNGLPMITNVKTGLRVKGSVPPPKHEGESNRAYIQRRFDERFPEDFDDVYEAQLKNAIEKGDSRDIENMMARGAGRPGQQQSGAADAVIDFFKLLAQANASTETTVVTIEPKQLEAGEQ